MDRNRDDHCPRANLEKETEMKKKKLSQTEMAKRLGRSRAAFVRLLNPENYSVTLLTLYRAAAILGKDLEIKFH